MSTAKQYALPPSELGNESYDKRFAAFLKCTNQKLLTSKILEHLLQLVSANTDIFSRESLAILDLGCGEGTLAKQLIPVIRPLYQGPLHYTGLDFNENFVNSFQEELKQFQDIKVAASQVDVFDNKAFTQADLVLASHMIYHSYTPSDKEGSSQKAQNFISNIVNALPKDSIAIAIHEASNSDMREIATQSGSELMPDATDVIQSICKNQEIPILDIPFEAKLTFPKLTGQQWDALKSTSTMTTAQYVPEMKEVLHLLGFIIQRDLNEMEEKELESFVSEVQNRLDDNNALTIRSTIQVLLSNERSPEFEEKMKNCCHITQVSVADIEKQCAMTHGIV